MEKENYENVSGGKATTGNAGEREKVNGITSVTSDNTVEDGSSVAVGNTAVEKAHTAGGIQVLNYDEGDILAQQISDDEIAVTDADVEKMATVWKCTAMPPLGRMGNLQGVLRNSIYAGIREDSDGKRVIEFCQRYMNGTFSPKMRIKQADIVTWGMYGRQMKKGKTFAKKVERIENSIFQEYTGKFRGDPDEILDTNEIVEALFTALPALPVQSDDFAELRRREFYANVVEIAETLTSQVFDKHNAYFPLTESDIIDIAQSMKMTRLDLLKRLRDYGFLYLTPCSNGYQTNVRFKSPEGISYCCWCYCLYKLDYFAGIEKKSNVGNWNF